MKPCRLLVVDIEPAPYKVDLFNAFVDSGEWDLFVFNTQSRDWSSEAGHDFRELPESRFPSRLIEGNGFASSLKGLIRLLTLSYRFKPDVALICGYKGLIPLSAILCSILARQRFVVWADLFNIERPSKGGLIGLAIRNLIRRIIFRTAQLVMMSGTEGCKSAVLAGCSRRKIINFPYVVNADRLASSMPVEIPERCLDDVRSGKIIVFFSGRHIPRKGLATLLNAFSLISSSRNCVLWVEGDGPMRQDSENLAARLEVASRCRFLGFCQMRLHAWLIRHADIVVVPSYNDAWGIVVDEAMQMGKAVCASDGVGSALDRIVHAENGLFFDAGDHEALKENLMSLLDDRDVRNRIGEAARTTARQWCPKRNVEALTRALGPCLNEPKRNQIN